MFSGWSGTGDVLLGANPDAVDISLRVSRLHAVSAVERPPRTLVRYLPKHLALAFVGRATGGPHEARTGGRERPVTVATLSDALVPASPGGPTWCPPIFQAGTQKKLGLGAMDSRASRKIANRTRYSSLGTVDDRSSF